MIDKVLTQWRAARGRARRRGGCTCTSTRKPLEVLGTPETGVTGFRYERTEPDGAGGVRGHRRDPRGRRAGRLPRRRLLRLAARRHPVRREARRHPEPRGPGARQGQRTIVPGVYATGWIKRGPVGLIGHTKSDAMETISHLVKDQASWWAPSDPSEAIRGRDAARARHRVHEPGRLARARLRTRSRSASRTAARASRSSRATRW